MKVYSVRDPYVVMREAKQRLVTEGYDSREIPWHEVSDDKHVNRTLTLGTGQRVNAYWSWSLSLYAFADEVHSPFRPNPGWRGGERDPDIYAATFDQWGLVLAAMLDNEHEADETGIGIRLSGNYDPFAKYAPKRSDGFNPQPFFSSRELFTAVTVKEYTAQTRDKHGVDLSCTHHKWGMTHPSGVTTCKKCGRAHRFQWDRGSW